MQDYLRPRTLDEALAVLGRGPVTVAAGCTDLYPATDRQRLPGRVLDISGIAGLEAIEITPAGVRIGAMATWAALTAAALPPAFDMLKEAAREVGSIQIQNAATVAGNLCNASPAADGVPGLLALDAEVEIASPRGQRQVPLAEFITGVRQTALAWDEMVTAVLVPVHALEGRSAFLKLGARRHLVISIAMVALRLEVEAGKLSRAAIAVGACSPVARRLGAVEEALKGQPLGPGLAARVEEAAVAAALDPISDVRADAAYRTHAAAELIRRGLRRLSADAVPA